MKNKPFPIRQLALQPRSFRSITQKFELVLNARCIQSVHQFRNAIDPFLFVSEAATETQTERGTPWASWAGQGRGRVDGIQYPEQAIGRQVGAGLHHALGDAVVDTGEAVGPVSTGLQLLVEPGRVAVQVQDAAGRRKQVVEIRPTPGRVVNDHVGLPVGHGFRNPSARLPNR